MAEKKKKGKTNETEVEKYFDDKKYNTLMVGEGGKFSVADKIKEDLAGLLLNEDRELKVETLKLLKGESGKKLLLEAISATEDTAGKQVLLAACWESDIDFSGEIDFFTELLKKEKKAEVVLEIVTVLEESIPQCEADVIRKLLKTIEDLEESSNAVINEWLENLKKSCENIL